MGKLIQVSEFKEAMSGVFDGYWEDVLDNMPAVDPLQGKRCGSCSHFQEDPFEGDIFLAGECLWGACYHFRIARHVNDYCSDWKRREKG